MEEWKSIPGFEGYEISNEGRVRSWKMDYGHKLRKEPYILKVRSWKAYKRVSLWNGNLRCNELIHRLVLISFTGPCPNGYTACHNDGNGNNNNISNLRWDTVKNNILDKYKHGTATKGETHSQAKLTEKEVKEIRWIKGKYNLSNSQIGELYGVTPSNIYCIIHRKSWSHI